MREHVTERTSPNTGAVLPIAPGKGYRYGCRCEDCLTEYRDRKEAERVRRLDKPIPEHGRNGQPIHGSWNGYANYGCRCELCLEASRSNNHEYAAEYRQLHREEKKEKQKEYYQRVKQEQLEQERKRRANK